MAPQIRNIGGPDMAPDSPQAVAGPSPGSGQQRPVLAFTTHALARETQPWHARCARVVTKETLTAELPSLLREGVAP